MALREFRTLVGERTYDKRQERLHRVAEEILRAEYEAEDDALAFYSDFEYEDQVEDPDDPHRYSDWSGIMKTTRNGRYY